MQTAASVCSWNQFRPARRTSLSFVRSLFQNQRRSALFAEAMIMGNHNHIVNWIGCLGSHAFAFDESSKLCKIGRHRTCGIWVQRWGGWCWWFGDPATFLRRSLNHIKPLAILWNLRQEKHVPLTFQKHVSQYDQGNLFRLCLFPFCATATENDQQSSHRTNLSFGYSQHVVDLILLAAHCPEASTCYSNSANLRSGCHQRCPTTLKGAAVCLQIVVPCAGQWYLCTTTSS